MAEAAELLNEPVTIRRFQMPDLDRHAGWLVPRIKSAYPHLGEREMIGWLRGLIYNAEHLFLFNETGAALFQVFSASSLSPQPIVREHFVWIADKDNALQQKAAAQFYEEARVWAQHQSASAIVVEASSDVPHDMIKAKLGRLFTRQEVFARC